MENDKLKRFIKTTIREFLNENKYVDDILDRKNKYGKISDDDKEYLDKYSSVICCLLLIELLT